MERETLRAEMETVLGVNQDTKMFRLEIAKLKTLVQGLVATREELSWSSGKRKRNSWTPKMQHLSMQNACESKRGKLRDCAS